MLSVGQRIPKKSVLFTIGGAKNKVALQDAARQLVEKGYTLYATPGTKRFFDEIGVPVTLVYHPHDKDMQPQALDLMHAHEIDMVVSVPKAIVSDPSQDKSYPVRRAAVDLNIPLLTNPRPRQHLSTLSAPFRSTTSTSARGMNINRVW